MATGRGLRVAAIVVLVATLAVAAALALAREDRTVATLDLVGTPAAVAVDCGLRGGSERASWGEAASRLCERPQADVYRRAGSVATGGGLVGLVLAALARRRRVPTRVPNALAAVAVAAGVPMLLLSGLLPASDVEAVDDALAAGVLDAVADDAVGAFDVVEVRPVRVGLRANEERWAVVDAPVDEVRGRLVAAGWSMEDVGEAFDLGWVESRSTGAADVVEIGSYGDVTDPASDTGRNARRLLDALDAPPAATVVHLRPPAFD